MNKSNKPLVAIFYGGRSGEHDISLRSAKCVLENIDQEKFIPVPVGIAKNGAWYFNKMDVMTESDQLALFTDQSTHAIAHADPTQERYFDIVLPMLHGKWGEDGTLQGLLDLAKIPYVGCGVLSSAICMDKDICKRLVTAMNIPTADYFICTKNDDTQIVLEKAQQQFSLPVFIKPANAGSSEGVSKLTAWAEMPEALEVAFAVDDKVLIEQGHAVRDIELAVLQAKQGDVPLVSDSAGEVVHTKTDFYSKDAKYNADYFPILHVPADVTEQQLAMMKRYAQQIFTGLECRGLARIDFFIDKNNGDVLFNEINTMPGFTKMSLFPQLWEKSGMGYQELLTYLIELALKQEP